MKIKTSFLILILGIAVPFINLFLQSCQRTEPQSNEKLAMKADSNYYIGSAECKSCHLNEYTSWQTSDHFLAMQTVNDSTVLGNFHSATYSADGVKNHFYKKNNSYFLETSEKDQNSKQYEVKYVFGYFPLQQYLIETEKGKLQSTRVSWNSRDKKWFHQYAGQNIHPTDWLHWTGNSQNWNTMCASCHSTNFKKNYDFESDSYQSTFSEINVSCESCHGAGATHKAFISSEDFKNGKRPPNSGFVYGKNAVNPYQVNVCANCHARKADISPNQLPSEELLDNMIPALITNEHYFADGQQMDEDYEYGSFVQSKMYHNNLKCSNCHDPHSGKNLMKGNTLCLSCHKADYGTAKHHFHKEQTESSLCINCHMTSKTYMGNDHRRDHSFRVPRPDQSLVYNTPNACTNCHTKKTNSWAAQAISKWYGAKRAYHFSDDLLPGSLLNQQSESHLIKLAHDTTQPEIARATAVYYLGNIPTEKAAEVLISLLRDNKAMLRFQSLRSLENFPVDLWKDAAGLCLSDKVRAVRIAAADLYHRTGIEQVPSTYKNAYRLADSENKNYLHYQRDFSVGNVMFADYELQQNNYLEAIKHYLRGLKKDSLMNYARYNLSAAYSSLGKNKEALQVLKDAAVTDPKNDRSFYNLGLLYYELGDQEASLNNFKKAVELGSKNSDLYYNYGLALQQNTQVDKAENIFLKGLSIDPNSGKLNYALTYLYKQKNDLTKAEKYARQLYLLDRTNKDYQEIYRSFGWQ